MTAVNDIAILYELNKTLEQMENLEQLYAKAVEKLGESLLFDFIAIFMLNPEEKLEMKSMTGVEVKVQKKGKTIKKELFKKEFQDRQLKIYQRKDKKEILQHFFQFINLQKIAIVPFITKNLLIGFLCVGTRKDAFTDDEKLLLEACAFSINFAITNLIIKEELLQQNLKLQTIAKNIRHDFANDLQSIGMTVELLLTTELSDEQNKFIRLLKNAKDSAVRRLQKFKELKNEFEKEISLPFGLNLEN
ncbi:MAG: GAF domain-containing protein [Candidatus Heimdallarchaeota archaeon]|nr:MAG: hypothetical protein DRP02_01660 [Candidatus Gerdarchaeota archaeon]